MRTIAGDAASPVVLHVPHGGTSIPAWVREGITLSDAELQAELDALTDWHTGAIAERATALASTKPWSVVNELSRFAVDVERFIGDSEEMNAVGMGAVYTRGTQRQPIRSTEADRSALLDAFYHPWAEAVAQIVDDRVARTGKAFVFDIHSYPTRTLPYELHGDGPRPAVCIGADGFHTPPWLVAAAQEAFAPVGKVAVNSPFAGAYVPLDRYGRDDRVLALMVEIRRDSYMAEPGGATHEGVESLATAIAHLIDAVSQQ